MEIRRYEYSEFDLTTYYVVEDGMTKCHINCAGDKIERSTTRPIPRPINSEEIDREELPDTVETEIDNILSDYE